MPYIVECNGYDWINTLINTRWTITQMILIIIRLYPWVHAKVIIVVEAQVQYRRNNLRTLVNIFFFLRVSMWIRRKNSHLSSNNFFCVISLNTWYWKIIYYFRLSQIIKNKLITEPWKSCDLYFPQRQCYGWEDKIIMCVVVMIIKLHTNS